jgi:hypothetical protein
MNVPKPRKQCKKCPWRVGVNPFDIPNGYCPTKHANLSSTIAEPGALVLDGPLRMMACHETHDTPCVGWVVNQLGEGNNIPLRLAVLLGSVSGNVRTIGKQHATLEETLPKGKKKRKSLP